MFSNTANITLEGVDGSTWELSGPTSWASPVRLEEGDVGALFDAPVETTYKDRVGQAGSSYLGHRFLSRVIVLNLTIYSAEHDAWDWVRVDSDFRKALSYDDDAILRVDTEISGERWIRVRLQEAPKYRGSLDPHESGISQYTVTLVAYDPYWRSDELVDEFVFDGLNWYGGGVTVDNPGDVATWPKWVLTAPAKFQLPDVSFKDDGEKDRQIVLPFQPLGRTVLVDTDPLQETITANDETQLWAELNGQFFKNPIPAYQKPTFIPVSIDPLPNLPVVLPPGWREHIAYKIGVWAKQMGQEQVFRLTPEELGGFIAQTVRKSGPSSLEPITGAVLDFLNIENIADRIAKAWGSMNNMAGATAQVRIERKWSRPWGLE